MDVIADTIFVMVSCLHGRGRRRHREEVSFFILNVDVLAVVDLFDVRLLRLFADAPVFRFVIESDAAVVSIELENIDDVHCN